MRFARQIPGFRQGARSLPRAIRGNSVTERKRTLRFLPPAQNLLGGENRESGRASPGFSGRFEALFEAVVCRRRKQGVKTTPLRLNVPLPSRLHLRFTLNLPGWSGG